MRLSNRFAYGYGHVTLYSPPQQGGAGGTGGVGLFGGEAEEVARVGVHCLPGEAEWGYEETLRRLLKPKREADGEGGEVEIGGEIVDGNEDVEGRRPSVVLLMSWKEPWTFLSSLRSWLALLAPALIPSQVRKDENPVEVLQEHKLSLTVVLQHVEAQEELERENYKEESFDYIAQTLRTCLLPLSAALVYTPSTPAPTQPGSPLSEVQKVIYSSLKLDLGALQTRRPGSAGTGAQAKREELAPRHNVVDRMAILVPSGWDSVGKIRLLSETFSPEAVLEGWMADLEKSSQILFRNTQALTIDSTGAGAEDAQQTAGAEDDTSTLQATGTGNAGAELYSSNPSPTVDSLPDEPPMSPSKMPKSAITPYTNTILNPNAHKTPLPPKLETTTKPNQTFLAEMRSQLQQFEAQDAERAKREPSMLSTTANALSTTSSTTRVDSTKGSGSALEDLGDVSFNVGGVSYNAASAEAAIERLKRPAHSSSSAGGAESPAALSTPRTGTPKPQRRERGEGSASAGVGAGGSAVKGSGELQTDKLEEYFASLMKRGGVGSRDTTPSKSLS